jgi:hypothetical protein
MPQDSMHNWGKQSRTIQFGNPRAEQKHKTTGGKKLPQTPYFHHPSSCLYQGGVEMEDLVFDSLLCVEWLLE